MLRVPLRQNRTIFASTNGSCDVQSDPPKKSGSPFLAATWASQIRCLSLIKKSAETKLYSMANPQASFRSTQLSSQQRSSAQQPTTENDTRPYRLLEKRSTGDPLNHTSRRSTEAQTRTSSAHLFRTSDCQVGNSLSRIMGSFGRQESTNQHEKNNASQCIANRRMSDCGHRRRLP